MYSRLATESSSGRVKWPSLAVPTRLPFEPGPSNEAWSRATLARSGSGSKSETPLRGYLGWRHLEQSQTNRQMRLRLSRPL
ncbi:unnamed protein product [Protopolystoma xenopodis]|uniref:Uncharacterized protein n=1 Tax=Protopolystoma xenopodis TaxID=117903 RepID=A0A3S5CKC6_9PLAT|nr:unnamed protein product [Protopolystoma xenopodis]